MPSEFPSFLKPTRAMTSVLGKVCRKQCQVKSLSLPPRLRTHFSVEEKTELKLICWRGRENENQRCCPREGGDPFLVHNRFPPSRE